jgi:RNA recognition motif-containing protein
MNKDIYVKNLAPDMTEDDLKKLFSVIGRVQSITLVTDPKPGQAKGTAYVTMATSDEARDAVNTLDGTRFLKKIIKVVASTPKRLGAATPSKAPKAKSRKK